MNKLTNHFIDNAPIYACGALLVLFFVAAIYGGKPRVIVVDGCQYLKSGNSALVHKANCPNH